MTVHTIASDSAFREAIRANKLVLLDFFAVWCAPCKVIAPILEEHSNDEKYQSVLFGKIDVDILSNLSDELDVQAMPTILLFKDGAQVDRVIDPQPKALVELLDRVTGESAETVEAL